MRSSVYRNAVVTACTLGLLGLLVGCLGISVSFESTDPDTSSPVSTLPFETNSASSVLSQTATATSVSSPVTAPNSQLEPSAQTNSILASRQKSTDNAKNQGTLRMSNRTTQPVRLALLARDSSVKAANASKKANYDVPAHWDFDPQEGGDKGLILSLPNGNLKLEKGDILVAFAQDGSRSYWGPYVVGETPSPIWDSQKQEWLLILSQ